MLSYKQPKTFEAFTYELENIPWEYASKRPVQEPILNFLILNNHILKKRNTLNDIQNSIFFK